MWSSVAVDGCHDGAAWHAATEVCSAASGSMRMSSATLPFEINRAHTVMARVLSPPLVLLLLLGLDRGHAPHSTLAGSCDPAETIPVKEGENRLISSKSVYSQDRIDLSVKPGSDFEGMRLDVSESGGTHHTAWFPADEECFPRSQWLQLYAVAGNVVRTAFHVGYRTENCKVQCSLDSALQEPVNLTVVAYGHSDWLKCITFEYSILLIKSEKNVKLSTCQEPPSTTTTTITTTADNTTTADMTYGTPSKKIITIAATAAGVVVVVVVVVVANYCKRSVIPPRPAGLAPPRQEPQVIENDDIYESFDGLANSAAPQTFHNELYESLSGYGPRHDS